MFLSYTFLYVLLMYFLLCSSHIFSIHTHHHRRRLGGRLRQGIHVTLLEQHLGVYPASGLEPAPDSDDTGARPVLLALGQQRQEAVCEVERPQRVGGKSHLDTGRRALFAALDDGRVVAEAVEAAPLQELFDGRGKRDH